MVCESKACLSAVLHTIDNNHVLFEMICKLFRDIKSSKKPNKKRLIEDFFESLKSQQKVLCDVGWFYIFTYIVDCTYSYLFVAQEDYRNSFVNNKMVIYDWLQPGHLDIDMDSLLNKARLYSCSSVSESEKTHSQLEEYRIPEDDAVDSCDIQVKCGSVVDIEQNRKFKVKTCLGRYKRCRYQKIPNKRSNKKQLGDWAKKVHKLDHINKELISSSSNVFKNDTSSYSEISTSGTAANSCLSTEIVMDNFPRLIDINDSSKQRRRLGVTSNHSEVLNDSVDISENPSYFRQNPFAFLDLQRYSENSTKKCICYFRSDSLSKTRPKNNKCSLSEPPLLKDFESTARFQCFSSNKHTTQKFTQQSMKDLQKKVEISKTSNGNRKFLENPEKKLSQHDTVSLIGFNKANLDVESENPLKNIPEPRIRNCQSEKQIQKPLERKNSKHSSLNLNDTRNNVHTAHASEKHYRITSKKQYDGHVPQLVNISVSPRKNGTILVQDENCFVNLKNSFQSKENFETKLILENTFSELCVKDTSHPITEHQHCLVDHKKFHSKIVLSESLHKKNLSEKSIEDRYIPINHNYFTAEKETLVFNNKKMNSTFHAPNLQSQIKKFRTSEDPRMDLYFPVLLNSSVPLSHRINYVFHLERGYLPKFGKTTYLQGVHQGYLSEKRLWSKNSKNYGDVSDHFLFFGESMRICESIIPFPKNYSISYFKDNSLLFEISQRHEYLGYQGFWINHVKYLKDIHQGSDKHPICILFQRNFQSFHSKCKNKQYPESAAFNFPFCIKTFPFEGQTTRTSFSSLKYNLSKTTQQMFVQRNVKNHNGNLLVSYGKLQSSSCMNVGKKPFGDYSQFFSGYRIRKICQGISKNASQTKDISMFLRNGKSSSNDFIYFESGNRTKKERRIDSKHFDVSFQNNSLLNGKFPRKSLSHNLENFSAQNEKNVDTHRRITANQHHFDGDSNGLNKVSGKQYEQNTEFCDKMAELSYSKNDLMLHIFENQHSEKSQKAEYFVSRNDSPLLKYTPKNANQSNLESQDIFSEAPFKNQGHLIENNLSSTENTGRKESQFSKIREKYTPKFVNHSSISDRSLSFHEDSTLLLEGDDYCFQIGEKKSPVKNLDGPHVFSKQVFDSISKADLLVSFSETDHVFSCSHLKEYNSRIKSNMQARFPSHDSNSPKSTCISKKNENLSDKHGFTQNIFLFRLITKFKMLEKTNHPEKKILIIQSMFTDIYKTFHDCDFDAAFSIFVFCVIKSQVKDLVLHLTFTKDFKRALYKDCSNQGCRHLEQNLSNQICNCYIRLSESEYDYYLTTFEACIAFIERLEFNVLNVTKTDFDRNLDESMKKIELKPNAPVNNTCLKKNDTKDHIKKRLSKVWKWWVNMN